MAPEARLITLSISPFNELARWSLERSRRVIWGHLVNDHTLADRYWGQRVAHASAGRNPGCFVSESPASGARSASARLRSKQPRVE
jgi:hypothetical protein